ncbi:hypothetical protein K8R47_03035 [archaeon]|nr:hypothetical protein [archaeon]
MVIRKTPQKIKEKILSKLNNQPLSVEQLRKNIKDSNWATINKHLEELKTDGEVREIISTGKIKIYQRIMGDTYFDLPITEDQRKKFKTLFYLIMKEYQLHKKIPSKTHLAKCAVHVIDNKESGLEDLPIIWYLYGMIPQMVADPSKEYQEEILLKHKIKIQHLIQEFVDENGNKGSIQIQKEQHEKYGEELYVITDTFFEKTNVQIWNDETILKLLNNFFINCPIDNEFPEVFELTEILFSLINKLSKITDLQEYRNKILLAFNSLWKFIALYKLYKSKTSGKNPMPKDILQKFYIGDDIEVRRECFYEAILDLKSAYLNKLSNFDLNKIKLSEGSKRIGKIMEDWTGED